MIIYIILLLIVAFVAASVADEIGVFFGVLLVGGLIGFFLVMGLSALGEKAVVDEMRVA